MLLFRCVSGLGPSNNNTNSDIGRLVFNDQLINNCNGLVQAVGETNITRYPGVYNIHICENLTTSTEGIYRCRLMNSSMMYQNTRVGVYFTGRSKLLHNG